MLPLETNPATRQNDPPRSKVKFRINLLPRIFRANIPVM